MMMLVLEYIAVATVCLLGIVLIYYLVSKMPKNNGSDRPKWYHNNDELDSTIRMVGGFAVLIMLITGMFIGDWYHEKAYLSDSVIHTVLGALVGWIAGTQRRSNGNSDKK